VRPAFPSEFSSLFFWLLLTLIFAIHAAFDKEWATNGHMDKAVKLMVDWVHAQNVPGLELEVRTSFGINFGAFDFSLHAKKYSKSVPQLSYFQFLSEASGPRK
jgi:hypothetical protein